MDSIKNENYGEYKNQLGEGMNSSQNKPKKPLVVDIRHPAKRQPPRPNKGKSGYFSPTGWRVNEKFTIRRSFSWMRWIISLFLIVAAASVLGYGAYLWTHRNEVADSVRGVYQGFNSLKNQLLNLDTADASDSLKKITGDIDSLRDMTAVLKGAPVLKEIPATFAKVNELLGKIAALNSEIAEVKAKGAGIFFKGSDGRFLQILRNAKKNLDDIRAIAADLRDRVVKLNIEAFVASAGHDYLSFNTESDRISEGLEALISILSKPGQVHFAVSLENPSEIRPAGGFSGSYADIVLENGEITDIVVNDIYYPVRFSSTKVIPPRELQTVTTRWTVQDAAWFFDFPTSGRKFLEFLEASSIYKDKNIKFEGDIAINVRLIEDILKLVGPIELPQYKLTLTDANFLREVQEEVEAGVDKKPGQNPKKILTFIAPVLIERLKNLPEDKRDQLVNAISSRLYKKDIKLYFKNKELEALAAQYGVAGDVFDMPGNWNGDYLAVVNANVAGGKTDAYISQEVKLASVISPEGRIQNILDVTRTHKGNTQAERWYRAANQNFMKIFTMPKTKLSDAIGGGTKAIKPPIDYQKSGYDSDPDLVAVESTAAELPELNIRTFLENGKTVFATWQNIPAGKSKTLQLAYANSRTLVLSPGLKYTFVLDKQSGIESTFKYSVEAPEGFAWRESGSSIYSYENSALPGRLVIQLTLQAQ